MKKLCIVLAIHLFIACIPSEFDDSVSAVSNKESSSSSLGQISSSEEQGTPTTNPSSSGSNIESSSSGEEDLSTISVESSTDTNESSSTIPSSSSTMISSMESNTVSSSSQESSNQGLTTLCVFDYDLTLSSLKCPETEADPIQYFCRENVMGDTYGSTYQCLGIHAKEAVDRCVQNGAYISINSHAHDYDYSDKIAPIALESQFVSWLNAPGYNNPDGVPYYPALDLESNINLHEGMYFLDDSQANKVENIKKSMLFVGLDPEKSEDKARVIFWDDSQTNIDNVTAWGDVRVIKVDRLGSQNGFDGGCGLTLDNIEDGWKDFPLYSVLESSSSAEHESSSVPSRYIKKVQY